MKSTTPTEPQAETELPFLLPEIITANRFTADIEDMVRRNRGMTYLEAMATYIEEKGIDAEDVPKKYLTGTLQQKLEAECQDLHLIQKTSRLPFDE